MKIVFFGTSEFAVPALKKLIDADFNILVITQSDRPMGRKQELKSSPIKVLAQKYKLNFFQPEKCSEVFSQILNFKPPLGIVTAYGEIIPQKILNLFPKGILNLHPSLLPKYRGPSPVQTAILNNEKITGITIILLDSQMDHGPILAQKEIPITEEDNNGILYNKLAELGADLLTKIIPKYLAGQIKPQPQNDDLATYTKIIRREDGQINWQNSAEQINAQFRAFYPWPGVYTYWRAKRLKIAVLSVLEGNLRLNLTPGTTFLDPKGDFLVKCGQGQILVKKIQLEGKKEMSAKDFLRGHQEIKGAELGDKIQN